MKSASPNARVGASTAIQAGAHADASAITATAPEPTPVPPNVDVALANIILVEGANARRIGQRMHRANYLNLALCLILFLSVFEITRHTPGLLFDFGLEGWLALDFVPVALTFTGADHLKRLKGIGLAWVGVVCLFYLAVQRAALTALLVAAGPGYNQDVSIPLESIACLCAAAALANLVVVLPAPRLLIRADVRKAFR
jgi:hypothetical protein